MVNDRSNNTSSNKLFSNFFFRFKVNIRMLNDIQGYDLWEFPNTYRICIFMYEFLYV